MTHNKIFIREDGSRVQIFARILIEENSFTYFTEVAICSPGSELFSDCCDGVYTLEYAKLSKNERIGTRAEQIEKYVTGKEIHSVWTELWKKLKPIF